MEFRFWHQCISCGKTVQPDKFYYTCPSCEGLLMVSRDDAFIKSTVGVGAQARNYFDALRFGYDRKKYPNDSGVWLWKDFILPEFPVESIISLKEGQTDLFEVPEWLRKKIGLSNLFIKMEGQAPSESFKDRGMPVAISDALRLQREHPELGIRGISCASTGDTSASAAIYSAYVQNKLSCLVLLPYEKISDPQLFQAMAHNAKVLAIKHKDGFDGCMQLIQEFTARHPEYLLVNSKNDMRIVGQETIGLEILQDCDWHAPQWIVIPVGNGGNLTALLSSLLRAREFGLIDTLPGIIGAQTEAADTLVRWYKSGYTDYKPCTYRDTVATAMNINNPVSFPRIQKLYDQFNIHFYSVSEKTILDRWAQFTRAGANICPQSAVALDAAIQARDAGVIKEKDTVISISTASGIKFTESGIQYHKNSQSKYSNAYAIVDGTVEALEKSL